MKEGMLEFIKSRRSTRKYKPDQVPDEMLNEVIEAGRYAPSGGNNQTAHFLVFRDPEVLKTLAEMAEEEFAGMEVTEGMYKSLANSIQRAKLGGYVFHYNAPVLIAVANRADYSNNIAAPRGWVAHRVRMANALALGRWGSFQRIGLNENERITAYLWKQGLQEGERIYGAVSIGWPDTADGLPVREPLKRTGNEVTYI